MTEYVMQNRSESKADKVLFERSFKDHYDGMYRYCMTMVRDQADAEDIVQSVFTEFWQDRHKIDIHTSIQAYLYKGVYFKCMNRIKREKVSQKYIATLQTNDQGSAQSDPAILEEVAAKITESIDAFNFLLMNTKLNINDDIITKYLCGEASPEEAISLENWKASSPQNKTYFDNMEQTFMLVSGVEKAVSDPQKVWDKINPDIPSKVISVKWMYGIAAVFLIGMVAVLFLINRNDEETLEIYAADKTVQKTLNDHSIITLQKNGYVSLDQNYGKTNRKLTLKGKAEFTVVHDEKLPFIIESEGVFIEDLGTIFTVESHPASDTVYVVVNEGIVRLYDEHGSEIIIKAGEKAWYIRSQKQIITSLDTKVLKFDFKDTKLSDAITLLSETYNVNIKLQPEGIGNCHITTQFFDEEVATIITIIAETLGFQYEYKNHQYIINGQPCK